LQAWIRPRTENRGKLLLRPAHKDEPANGLRLAPIRAARTPESVIEGDATGERYVAWGRGITHPVPLRLWARLELAPRGGDESVAWPWTHARRRGTNGRKGVLDVEQWA